MRNYVAEFIGTFALVFCGTGAIIIDQQFGGTVTHPGVSITFGLIVMSMIYALGGISGAHLNPAVSIAFLIKKDFSVRQLPGYVISQVTGALAASLILKLLFAQSQLLGATMPAGTDLQSFVLEMIMSFFLMLVIINVAEGGKEKGMFAGLAIGAIVGLEAMFGGPVSGASMNPARSIGPAVASLHIGHLWIYIIAPIAGMAAAVPVCNYLSFKTKRI
ncbi:MAG TPA: aquaporin [Mucilaginibacter sp.]|nr:aquaporin [Mucilaginibacter sp.]